MKKRFTKKGKITIIIILVILVLITTFLIYWFRNPFVKEYTMEAGTSITITDLLEEKEARKPRFITEMNDSIINKAGDHKLKVHGNDKDFEVILHVVDTIAPVVEVQSYHYFVGDEFDAKKFIKTLEDKTDVTTTIKQDIDLTKSGKYEVEIVFTDEGNNSVTKKTKLTVEKDTTAPKIEAPKTIKIKKGETILYKKLIKVTDNRDGEMTNFEIDNSNVNLTRVGNYTITIKATDHNNNTSKKTIPLIIELKDKAEAKAEAIKYAKDLINKVTKSSMTKDEKAKAVCDYIRKTYKYIPGHSGTLEDYHVDALNAFITNQTDCFGVNGMARVALEVLGFKTIGVGISNGAYVSLEVSFMANGGDGWYHYCCLRQSDGAIIHKWTDAQFIEQRKVAAKREDIDLSSYPDTPLQ